MSEWIRKEGNEQLEMKVENGVTFLSFPALEQSGLVKQGFSTRMGGVSEGKYATMNFTFGRGDKREHVLENYQRMADALEVPVENMVLSYQTHTTNVMQITEDDCGKGIWKDRDYTDVDGLITNIPEITLVTFYADCVPLYFVDRKNKAIGLSHSGWRGTVGRMGQKTLDAMKEAYGTRPRDVISCIGPSICKDCFEVGKEVVEEFQKEFSKCYWSELIEEKDNGKYQLDLWRANQIILEEAGIPKEQIHTTDICTRCNPTLLFSHRFAGTERGNLAAFLSLKNLL